MSFIINWWWIWRLHLIFFLKEKNYHILIVRIFFEILVFIVFIIVHIKKLYLMIHWFRDWRKTNLIVLILLLILLCKSPLTICLLMIEINSFVDSGLINSMMAISVFILTDRLKFWKVIEIFIILKDIVVSYTPYLQFYGFWFKKVPNMLSLFI